MYYGEQVIWPPHCIIGTKGAEFHKNLITNKANFIIRKGFRKNIDSYSGFYENDRTYFYRFRWYIKIFKN